MSDVISVSRHRLNVDDFQRMGAAGILTEDNRVELIEGDLIDMAPIGSEHAGVVYLLNRRLTLAIGQEAIVGVQSPIVLGTQSEPQPDVLVLKPRDDFYRTSHPRPEDALLLIEVADSSVQLDREVKIPLYARHGVPEVWLVDLVKKCVEVYRLPEPDSSRYQRVERWNAGILAAEQLPAAKIDVGELFCTKKRG